MTSKAPARTARRVMRTNRPVSVLIPLPSYSYLTKDILAHEYKAVKKQKKPTHA
jgi:hypothetical protein